MSAETVYRLGYEEFGALWKVYREAMEPTRHLAVQRHMLTREEFDALLWNAKIAKVIAYDDNGSVRLPVGLALWTRDLDAYDLIEPAYFAHRYPEATAAKKIYYTIFVVAAPWAPRETFADLVRGIVAPIRARKGIGALDWSRARIDKGLARAAQLIIGRDAPLRTAQDADSQHFMIYEFDWPEQ
jgi:hypothetical protein